MMQQNSQPENTYLNDPENAAEMARLLDQDRILTESMNGLLPEREANLEGIHNVLDIACGPGGWAQEMAFKYPAIEVTGIDISKAMVEYARMQARVQKLENATFFAMDATRPLEFADESFDLVNIRTIAGFMLKESWPRLIGECSRVLRPGGVLRLTETDHWGIGSSPAMAKLSDLVYEALLLTGHSFDASGHSFGITPMLERLLTEAGYQHIGARAHVVNFSTGTKAHSAMYHNIRVFYKLVQPFLLKTGRAFSMDVPSQEELDRLYEQMLVELLDNFVGNFFLLTVWGEKQ
jgi:SAM-dependent methyltransferase